MSIIALHTIHTSWSDAISELVTFSLRSPSNLVYGCTILENIASELEESHIKLKPRMQIMSMLIGTIPTMVEFAAQVVPSPDVSPEAKQKVLAVVEAWIALGNSQMLMIDKIQALLFECYKDPLLQKSAIQCICKGLEYCRFARLLESAAYETAFKELSSCPLIPFITSLLYHTGEVFTRAGGNPEAGRRLKHHSELLFSIGKNFPILMLRVFTSSRIRGIERPVVQDDGRIAVQGLLHGRPRRLLRVFRNARSSQRRNQGKASSALIGGRWQGRTERTRITCT